ncbi:hypothetical protein BJ912DRAFT_1148063 [Pholiota molesta]|nr:hypothetical protein BJ912DRAFT_1148063 [Pholiota molesta]
MGAIWMEYLNRQIVCGATPKLHPSISYFPFVCNHMFETDIFLQSQEDPLPNANHGGGATDEHSDRAYIATWLAEVSNSFPAKDNPFDSPEIDGVDRWSDLSCDERLRYSSDAEACTPVELGNLFRRSRVYSRSRILLQNRRHRPGYSRRRYYQRTRLPQRGNRFTYFQSRPSRLRLSVSAQSSDLAVWLLSPQTNVGQRVVVNEEVGSAREDRKREGNVAPSAHGTSGLLNVWRARRTSLVTATAVQQSPAVQTRAFVALSGLAAAEVDDDFLYQILVAFNGTMSKANESNTTTIVISSLANSCPEIIGITYDTLQDRIHDTFANSSNASIIRSVSTIFRAALQDKGPTSTLGTIEENSISPGRSYVKFGMQGLAINFTFLPPNRGVATRMINWIPTLVTLMIS